MERGSAVILIGDKWWLWLGGSGGGWVAVATFMKIDTQYINKNPK
jgi:hypothetical protein